MLLIERAIEVRQKFKILALSEMTRGDDFLPNEESSCSFNFNRITRFDKMSQNIPAFSLAFRPAPRPLFSLNRAAIRTGATIHGRTRLAGTRLQGIPKVSRDVGERQLRHAENIKNPRLPQTPSPLIPADTATPQEITPTEAYFIRRTPTRNLPIYQLRKSGGNLKQTRVRKVEGDVEALKVMLEERLTPVPKWIRVNPVNMHVEMKVCEKLKSVWQSRMTLTCSGMV